MDSKEILNRRLKYFAQMHDGRCFDVAVFALWHRQQRRALR